jgi:uracil-DNA glycosylase
MARLSARQRVLDEHVALLRRCRRCPRMVPPPVSGGPVLSKVMLIGQAPGVKEPVLARPFAWTAGRTLFGWFNEFCGMAEAEVRARIYFAAVCRCFPGKTAAGGDRVPAPDEIRNCSSWMNDEMAILRPQLVIAVGKLAISQFMAIGKLDQVIGACSRCDASDARLTSFLCRILPAPRHGIAFRPANSFSSTQWV